MTRSQTSVAAQHYIDGKTNAERARALLIMPHGVLLDPESRADILRAASSYQYIFTADYIDAVTAAHAAVRMPTGRLPDAIVATLNGLCDQLITIASMTGDEDRRIQASYEAKRGMKDLALYDDCAIYRETWDATNLTRQMEGVQ